MLWLTCMNQPGNGDPNPIPSNPIPSNPTRSVLLLAQTPTLVPELVLLYLTLQSSTVNGTALDAVLRDRSIDATILNVTRYGDGQYSVVQVTVFKGRYGMRVHTVGLNL